MMAADGAVVVIDTENGVEVGTEDVWARAAELSLPRIIFINKMDRPDANIDEVMSGIREQLSQKAMIIDLSEESCIERIAESDDALLEAYLENGSLDANQLAGALRKAVLEAKLFPVLTGSALNDTGVVELLEAVIRYMPSPVEHPAFVARDLVSQELRNIIPSDEGPFTGFVVKSIFDPHIGHLALMRVLRGRISANSDFININSFCKEHVSGLAMLQGKQQETILEASCGDIVAVPKLNNTHVSDCLTNTDEMCVLDPIRFPEPSISVSIKPKTRADEEKISASLEKLCEQDHAFRVSCNPETKELIVSGVGDLHLKILVDRMNKRYNVDVELEVPRVSYREAVPS